MATTAQPTSFLATRQGKLLLALLCAVAFLDFLDASIVNVALPTIRRDLHFTVQNLQWVLSGYLLTYGGATTADKLRASIDRLAALAEAL